MTNRSDAEVKKMTVKQISEVLKELGLSTKGPKIELQSRLLGAVERATVQCNTNTASIQASLVHASATATTAAVSYTTQLNQQEIPVLKLILLGDGGVGKSNFISRFFEQSFERSYNPTTEAMIHTLVLCTNRGAIKLNVWDTVGQEKGGSLRDKYYIQADGAIIMFDLTSRVSHRNISNWHSDLTRQCENIPIVIVGNKADLNLERKVTAKQITFHRKKNLQYYDMSAKLNYNLEKPFLYLIRKLSGDHTLCFVEAPAVAPKEFLFDEKIKQQLLAHAADVAMPLTSDSDDSDNDDDL